MLPTICETCARNCHRQGVKNCLGYKSSGARRVIRRHEALAEKTQAPLELGGKTVYIDTECVAMVKLFNETGLKTKFSCSGHGLSFFNIVFDNSVTDGQIEAFVGRFENERGFSPLMGKFSKWLRKISGELVYTWMYEAETLKDAMRDLALFSKAFEIDKN